MLIAVRSATLLRAASLVSLIFLQPCVGPCTDWSALDVRSKADIKRSPLQSNTVDMSWTVGPFKPRDLVTGEKLAVAKGDKRFCFKGKGQDLDNFAVLGGLRGRDQFSLGSTISLADSDGLRSGETSSWVYATYDGDPPVSYQVSLLYDAAIPDGEGTAPGWIAHAYIDDASQGQVAYPGVAELDVRLVQDADSLDFLARPSVPYAEEGQPAGLHAGAFDTIFTQLRSPSDGFEIGFGAFGIDKGGAVYTDMFWFLGPELGPEPASEESFVFDQFGDVGSCLRDAKAQLSGPSVSLINVEAARDQVSSALNTAINTMFSIKNTIASGGFAQQTDAKSAAKIGKQTYKKLHKLQDQLQVMLDKSVVNQGKLKGICKTLAGLIDSSTVGQANMLGVQASSYKQIDRGVPIDAGDLPDIFGGS